ncbi:hypothetical protein Ahy_B09g098099 [Arachis hypogaea]|uniref:Uncharacterized protein n=1 Tax=Arachis hypogaea TaxID=3818 RepID=A0A444XR55_ARAHY|nr:hypothetical protein Ahy_B09g098099 [Arachis hypogaea]
MHIPPMNKHIGHLIGPLFPSKVNFKEFIKEDKEVYRSFQGKILKQLTDSMMEISVDGNEDQLKFRRTFILYIQMSLCCRQL